MDDRKPIGVFRQLSDKTDPKHGSTYRVLGLGLISNFDADADVFVVESIDRAALETVTETISDETLRYEVQLYAQLTNRFQPFVNEGSVTYTTTIPKRDKAFREIIVRSYDYTCAVCGMKFRWNTLVEATAAHIIPKHKNGTDDPRNGLSLCRTHHWAFDEGIFSLSENYEILLSPVIPKAEGHDFPLFTMEGVTLSLPASDLLRPHSDAIRWHRENTWRT